MRKKLLVAFSIAVLTMTTSVMGAPVVSAAETTTVPSKTEAPIADIKIGDNTVTTDGKTEIKVPGGTVTVDDGRIQVGDTITLTINPESGKKLTDWGITGDYTPIEGDKTSTTIKIRVNGNISINPKFADATVETTTASEANAPTVAPTTATTSDDEDFDDEDFDDEDDDEDDGDDESDDSYKGSSDSSTKSPKTGLPVGAVAAILLASSGAALSLRKKED